MNQSETLAFKSRDGVELSARAWIPVTTHHRTVIIVHGMGEHSGSFDDLSARLNARGFPVFSVDFRGHGRSGGQRGFVKSFDDYFLDLDAIIGEVENRIPGKISFYCQSMGATVALSYLSSDTARSSRISSVVASSPCLRIAIEPPRWKVTLGKVLRKVAPKVTFDAGIKLASLSNDQQAVDKLRADNLRHNRICPELYFGMMEFGQRILDHPGLIKTPTLLLHGGNDQVTDAAATIQLAETSPPCELKQWPDMLHELHRDTGGQKVIEYAINWLESQPVTISKPSIHAQDQA